MVYLYIYFKYVKTTLYLQCTKKNENQKIDRQRSTIA